MPPGQTIFSTRNALYLRISRWVVLPLYLYLDERHVAWMSDTILQAVLADLRPKLADKMRREMDEMGTGGGGGGSSSKSKSPVEVHRAENYQFAFFFRKTDSRHVVLLKKRKFDLQPVQSAPPQTNLAPQKDEPPTPRRSTTAARSVSRTTTPRRARQSSTVSNAVDGDRHTTDAEQASEDEPFTPRRSKRARTGRVLNYADDQPEEDDDQAIVASARVDPANENRDYRESLFLPEEEDHQPQDDDDDELVAVKEEPMDDEELAQVARSSEATGGAISGANGTEEPGSGLPEVGGAAPTQEFSPPPWEQQDPEEEDEKKDFKPVLRMSYTGFTIHSRHLVLIIEPWPPIEPADRSILGRPRSTFSSTRSVSRRGTRQSNSVFDREREREDSEFRSQTPLVPNSRRGGTSSATPGPSSSSTGNMRNGATPSFIPQSRSGCAARSQSRMSSTPFSRFGSVGPPGGSGGRSSTPLFREATPLSDAGGDMEDEDQEEEDEETFRSFREDSWGIGRGSSEAPDDYIDEDVEDARDLMADAESLFTNTQRRTGSEAIGSGADKDEDGEADGTLDDVGGGD